MINTSSEYKRLIADSVTSALSRDFTAKATITLADETVLNITEADIVVNGLKINDSTSASNSFQIGSAIINQCTLMLNNIGGKFDSYDFDGAIIRPYVGLKLSGSTEWILKGYFTVDEATITKSIISLVALDNMDKFDIPFSGVGATFPISAGDLLRAVCTYCGVFLQTSTFLNDNLSIVRAIGDEAVTCREIVSWVAQLSGNFARCDVNGALELKWYPRFPLIVDGGLDAISYPDTVDGGKDAAPLNDILDGSATLNYHHIYALSDLSISTFDIAITGIQVKAKGDTADYGETALSGTTGYVIEISDNPLIQEGYAQEIADSVGMKINGMRFRTCDIKAIADPSREAGDIAYVTDRKQNTYPIFISNITYQIGNKDSISCDAETPSKKSSMRFSAATKAIFEAQEITRREITAYDLMVQRLTDLITQSTGMYKTDVPQEDGSVIYYTHDKATMEGSTVRWFMSGGNLIEQTQSGGIWTTVSGVDKQGNALYNILTTRGINAEWLNVGSKLGGFTISDGGLYTEFTETFGPFTQADKDYISTTYILGGATPTAADLLKYDLSRDGRINSLDVLMIDRIIQGIASATATYSIYLNSENPTKMIRLVRSGGGYNTGTTGGVILGASQIEASSYKVDGLYGASGTFTSADGKTITVTGGLITNIV